MDRAKLQAELRRDEGEELTAYKDSLGYWTIGVGHLIDPKKGADPAPFGVNLCHDGAAITPEQSAQLLDTDIDAKCAELDHALPWWRSLTGARQRALLNMAFNLGVGSAERGTGLLGFKNTLALIQKGNFEGARRGMLASKWADQVGDRAKRLAAMMVAG